MPAGRVERRATKKKKRRSRSLIFNSHLWTLVVTFLSYTLGRVRDRPVKYLLL